MDKHINAGFASGLLEKEAIFGSVFGSDTNIAKNIVDLGRYVTYDSPKKLTQNAFKPFAEGATQVFDEASKNVSKTLDEGAKNIDKKIRAAGSTFQKVDTKINKYITDVQGLLQQGSSLTRDLSDLPKNMFKNVNWKGIMPALAGAGIGIPLMLSGMFGGGSGGNMIPSQVLGMQANAQTPYASRFRYRY